MTAAVSSTIPVWAAKLVAIVIGVGFIGAGVALMLFGEGVVPMLNRMYAVLPGRFQYPLWWHRFTGGIICGFGLIVAVSWRDDCRGVATSGCACPLGRPGKSLV